jgi:2-polyprenyl-6-methoxyphenol hydroxylase-like FAD-dependent oxidoreductase
VFAQAAELEPSVTIRRGVRVAGLSLGASAGGGIPHVAGVRVTGGEAIPADLVIDATGRQSRSPDWLEAIGARAPYEERADSGFAYYTRYFRGTQPESRAGSLMHLGTMSLLTLPGDNGTWSVTVFVEAGDQPLKSLRHRDKWTNVLRACPLHAHWLEGEPISDVLAMAGIVDRYRRFVVEGSPVATGFVAVADASACTNPSAGRGLTVGFRHAVLLRDVLRDAAANPGGLVREFAARTEAEITPWYQAQRIVDRARFADMVALREGGNPSMPEDDLSRAILGLLRAMPSDPELFRAALEYISTITPVQTILRRPEVVDRLRAAQMQGVSPMRPPGPSRQQLLDLLK